MRAPNLCFLVTPVSQSLVAFFYDSLVELLFTYEPFYKKWQRAATSSKMMYETTDSQHLKLKKGR